MGDLLMVIGQWIEDRFKTRGVLYKLGVGLGFVIIIALFARDILAMFEGAE